MHRGLKLLHRLGPLAFLLEGLKPAVLFLQASRGGRASWSQRSAYSGGQTAPSSSCKCVRRFSWSDVNEKSMPECYPESGLKLPMSAGECR